MPKSEAPRKRNQPANKRPGEKRQKKIDRQNELMNDIKEADTSCRDMLAQVAKFSPYLMNKDLVAAGDGEQIHNYSAILSRDTIQLRQELDALWMQIPDKIDPDNTDDVAKAMSLGGKYQDWQDRYERVVMPTIQELEKLLKEAAKNYGDGIEDAEFEEVTPGDSNE